MTDNSTEVLPIADDGTRRQQSQAITPLPPPHRSVRRRVLHQVALATLVVVIVAAVGYDVVTGVNQHHAASVLAVTRVRLKDTRATLSTTNRSITSANATRNARVQAQDRTLAQTATVTKSLASAMQTSSSQTLDIATIHTCLAGVSNALSAVQTSNLQGAVNSITAASSACLTLDGSSAGLAYPFDFPDPFVLTVGSQYYAFATNSVAGNIQIIQSSDLTHWTTLGDALPHLAMWAQPGATWAPSVVRVGASYVMYYSAVFGATGEQCISEAVATQPQGPYVDSSTWPLECQLDRGGSIDPSPFVDSNGTLYLTWKSQGTTGQLPILWSEQLTASGTAISPGTTPSALLTPTQSWQGGVIEGPDLVVVGGQHLLFYSANDWKTANYAVGDATCSGPLGPCTPEGGQPLLASQQGFSGPGGPALFTDSTGNLTMAFAAWLPGKIGFPNSRMLFLHRITISEGVPEVSP